MFNVLEDIDHYDAIQRCRGEVQHGIFERLLNDPYRFHSGLETVQIGSKIR